MRKEYDVFLLMTGLYEKINELQNEDTLTFLYRAPTFEMTPLNSRLVAKQYKQIFNLSEDEVAKMASVVQGYPYAYQVLGYLCYKNQSSYESMMDEFDAYLAEYVYDKIWFEMSETDREVARAITQSTDGKVKHIRQNANMSSEVFSVYRNRLLKKGLVSSQSFGYLQFTLPRFEKYVESESINLAL